MPEWNRRFPGEIERVEDVFAFLRECAAASALTPGDLTRLELVAEEAFVNICSYAYAPLTGDIDVRFAVQDDRVALTFADRGKPFDPLQNEAPDTGKGLDEREAGGLGVLLMREMMDRVEYERRGDENVLRLILDRKRVAEK